MGHTWQCPECPGDIITSLVTAWLATLCSVCRHQAGTLPQSILWSLPASDERWWLNGFMISYFTATQELCWKCILHPFTQDSCWYMVRLILSLLIWKVYELTSMSELRNVKSACDVWELCHKLLNCLNLQLCSVERSLNIILSLIFRCARAGSTISWVMEQGWKGSTVPRYWLRSSCSPAGQWLTVC